MRISAILIAASMTLTASAVLADSDGVTRSTILPGNPALPGISVDIADGSVGKAELTGALQTEIDGKANTTDVDAANAAQDAVTATKASTADVDAANAAQDADIATKASKTYVDAQDAKKVDKTRLDNFGPSNAAPAGSVERWAGGVNSTLTTHNQQIAALESTTADHERAISAHSALLSQHTAELDRHAKGIAIAMALPDAWIESNKRFAVAGSVGGFDSETAIGAAAILRLDDIWSVNGKLGADTDFSEMGWQVGARASW